MFKVKIKEMPRYPYVDTGWGNGYVGVPPKHWLHGLTYDHISNFVNVNGGLTFSGYMTDEGTYWWFGFDTGHVYNTLQYWPMDRVLSEAEKLRNQLENLNISQLDNDNSIDSYTHCEVCAQTELNCKC